MGKSRPVGIYSPSRAGSSKRSDVTAQRRRDTRCDSDIQSHAATASRQGSAGSASPASVTKGPCQRAATPQGCSAVGHRTDPTISSRGRACHPHTHTHTRCHPRGTRSPRRGQSCRSPPPPHPAGTRCERPQKPTQKPTPLRARARPLPADAAQPKPCRRAYITAAPHAAPHASGTPGPAPPRRPRAASPPPPPFPLRSHRFCRHYFSIRQTNAPGGGAVPRFLSGGQNGARCGAAPAAHGDIWKRGAALELRSPHRNGSEPAERRCGAARTELQRERGTGGEGGGSWGVGRGAMRGPLRGVGGVGREKRGRSPGDAEGLRRCGEARSGAKRGSRCLRARGAAALTGIEVGAEGEAGAEEGGRHGSGGGEAAHGAAGASRPPAAAGPALGTAAAAAPPPWRPPRPRAPCPGEGPRRRRAGWGGEGRREEGAAGGGPRSAALGSRLPRPRAAPTGDTPSPSSEGGTPRGSPHPTVGEGNVGPAELR